MEENVTQRSQEEIEEVLLKVNEFLNELDSKYTDLDLELNLPKIVEIRNFIVDNDLFDLNLEIFELNETELASLEHSLKTTYFKSKNGITYEPKIPEGFESVEVLKDKEIIFKEYHDLIPNVCDACGHKIIANEALTIVKCSNLRCKHNLASSLRKIAVKESISGLGGKTCYSYFENGRMRSILDVFEYPDANIYDAYNRLKLRKREYAEWVRMLSLPGIEAQANYLFKGINCYDDYLKELNKCGTVFNFCLSRLGGEGKQAGNIAQVLEAYDYELQHLEDIFPIGVEAEKIVYIAMTGHIYFSMPGYGKFTKDKFLSLINNIYPEYVSFRKTESVSKAFMVISDYPSGSSKYVAAKSQDKLISSDKLVKLMMETEYFLKVFFPKDFEEKVEKLKSEGRFYTLDKEE